MQRTVVVPWFSPLVLFLAIENEHSRMLSYYTFIFIFFLLFFLNPITVGGGGESAPRWFFVYSSLDNQPKNTKLCDVFERLIAHRMVYFFLKKKLQQGRLQDRFLGSTFRRF